MPPRPKVQRDTETAEWRRFSNSEEDQRLRQLDDRITLKNATLAEAVAERRRIMMRIIRRMRRAKGKE